MRKIKSIPRLANMLVFMVLAISCSTSTNDTKASLVRDLMTTYHDIGQFNGAVLVSQNNHVIFEGAYGEANREWNIPNTIDTKFRLASVTKQFTAALVMDLVEEGKLDLQATISNYLPEHRKDVADKVTIHHLLTHSAGFSKPNMTLEEYWDTFQKRMSKQQIQEQLCSEPLNFEPGTKYSYSSAGYMVLGAIIEQVTGKSWEHALRERILDPAGMSHTGVDDPDAILPERASGYQTNFGSGNARFKYMPTSYSSGALYSTVRDMYKWDQALNSHLFLSEESTQMVFTPHIPSYRGSYGYGWYINEMPVAESTVTRVFHGGDASGFCAFIVRTLETNDCVILLSNQEGLLYYDIAFNILKLLNNEQVDTPKAYVSDILRTAVYSKGLDKALQQYELARNAGLINYNTDEDEIIELGYDLLAVDNIEAAIAVFKIGIELHPKSANAFDSLGEGYLVAKNYALAKRNYQKSLELDATNTNATDMLGKIDHLMSQL
jgi:CubicO group peptidase (beta-lactamase class C family)